MTDSEGRIIADGLDPARYREFLGEAVERDSYLKTIAILLRIIEA